MSKTFGLAGLRIGWLVTKDTTLYKRLQAYKDFTSLCNSAPSEFFSKIALRNSQTIIKRNLGIILDNLVILDKFFEKYKHLFQWNRPRAGAIGFVEIKFDMSVLDFVKDVV